MEQPVYNPSMSMYCYTNKFLADNDIVVTLAGDMGDEILAGYPKYWKMKNPEFLQKKIGNQCKHFRCDLFNNDSVNDLIDFLNELGLGSYKIASGDLTNFPLIEKVNSLIVCNSQNLLKNS